MKKILLFVAVLAVAILTGGCGAKPAPVTLVNNLHSWDITDAYIHPEGEPEGENLLTEILSPDDSVTISVPAGENMVIRLVDEDGDTYTMRDVTLTPEGYQWNVILADID